MKAVFTSRKTSQAALPQPVELKLEGLHHQASLEIFLLHAARPPGIALYPSAAEALQLIEERKPDLVLATHAMLEGEALQLAQRIKARPAAPVIVVLTERSDAQLEAACEAAGVDFCVEKRHLQARLLGFLRQRFSVRLARQNFLP